MAAVLYRTRAELRRSWRGSLAVALLVALVGAVVLAAAAGARRTASAFPRMQEAVAAPELLVGPLGNPEDPEAFEAAVAALPGVRVAAPVIGVPMVPLAGSPTAALVDEGGGTEAEDLGIVFAGTTDAYGNDVNRPLVTDGRLPDPDATDEALVSAILAERTGLRVGAVLDVVLIGEEATSDLEAAADQGLPLRLRVTGIGTLASEVVPASLLEEIGTLLVPRAVADLVAESGFEPFFAATAVDLDPGADPVAVGRAAEALADDPAAGSPGPLLVVDEAASGREVQDSIAPLAAALGAFAAVVGVLGALVVAQAVARATRQHPDDVLALSAIGTTRGGRLLGRVVHGLVIGAVAAVVAVVVAAAASGRFPVGPARAAEPDPGLAFDLPVVAAGVVAVVAVAALGVLPGALLDRRDARQRRLATAASTVAANLGLRPPAVQGIRMALDRGSGATPSRSTVIASVVAAACVLAAATYATSLDHLLATPEHYGQGWDRMADGMFGFVAAGHLVDELAGAPGVEGIAGGRYAEVVVAGRSLPAVGMVEVVGDAGLTVVRGSRATGPGEIALGGESMALADLSVGDTVEVDTGTGPQPLRVVGELLFPRLTQGSFIRTGLGVGAQVHPDDLPPPELDGEEPPPDFVLDGRLHNFLTIATEGDTTEVDAVLRSAYDRGEVLAVQTDAKPPVIADLDRVRSIPISLAIALALAAAAILAHLLVTSVSGQRRELALLRTLGFARSQLRATVRWHATLVAAVAVAVGLPVGVAAGRTLWRAFADGIGAPSPPAVPWPWVVLAAPAAIALAIAVASIPAWRAGRVEPAAVLRSER